MNGNGELAFCSFKNKMQMLKLDDVNDQGSYTNFLIFFNIYNMYHYIILIEHIFQKCEFANFLE
jgi:hypothetical protein